MKNGLELAYEVTQKVERMNFSKPGLEHCLGIVLARLMDGGKNFEDIDSAGELMLALRQDNGLDDFLAVMKKAEMSFMN